MNTSDVPEDLQRLIEHDTIDFITKAKRNFPIKKSLGLLFFGTAWTALSSIFIQSFTEPFLASKSIPVPGLVIGLFFIVGIGILISGLSSLFQKGGFFIGTAQSLIKYRNGKITRTAWNEFTEKIEITNKVDDGSLAFTLNTFSIDIPSDADSNRTTTKVTYDKIYMTDVQEVYEIERKCRKRILENLKK
jgi:hypothetical protein